MFNEHKNVEAVCTKILEGTRIALISDAGTPGISDPGFLLVRTCIEKEIPVETLPGPTALIPALVNSGLPCDRFCFEGFLPPKKGRNKRITALTEETRTMVFYESPYRLVKTLDELAEHFGPDREASVSRELSKLFEETIRGTLTFLSEHYTRKPPKGEIVIVVSGKKVIICL
jgi:16S rRNA (cytidine1402-2'-O)-methyltransferase